MMHCGPHLKNCVLLLKTCLFQKAHVNKKKQAPAASLKRSNNGLGLPIHIKKVPILLNIRYYIILVLNSLLYINYIKFPIRIRDFPNDFSQLLTNIVSCLPKQSLLQKGCHFSKKNVGN